MAELISIYAKSIPAEFFKNQERIPRPFDRCTSRLIYKPDLFQMRLVAPSIKDLFALPRSQLTWEECCYNRAIFLKGLNLNKYYVMYSGGIDSTVAVISLLKYWPASDRAKVTILLTHSSILENPSFFENHILPNFKIDLSLKMNGAALVNENACVISGELGDQLFGSDMLGLASHNFGDESLMRDYKIIFPKILAIMIKEPVKQKIVMDMFFPIVEESPLPIRTTHDFLWWWNFTQKWQNVMFRFLELTSWDLGAKHNRQVFPFFDTIDFQKWSLENHDLKIKDTWQSYKFTAKEFIYSFTKNKSDLMLIKKQSLKNLYHFSQKRIAILDDYTEITNIDDLRKYARN